MSRKHSAIVVFVLTGVLIHIFVAQEQLEQYRFFSEAVQVFYLDDSATLNKEELLAFPSTQEKVLLLPLLRKVDALQLQYFILLTRFDPIFAIEGTDPAALKTSIASLRKQINEIASQHTAGDKQLISDALYPTAFLSALSDLETRRVQLFDAPSQARAKAYHHTLRKVSDMYASHIATFSHAIAAAGDDSAVYHFLDGATDREMTLSVLQDLLGEIEATKQELGRRWRCYRGATEDCPSIQSAYDKLTERNELPLRARTRSTDKIPLEHATVYSSSHEDGVRGVVLTIAENGCTPRTGNAYFLMRESAGNSDKKLVALRTLYLNDLYFYKTDISSTDAYFSELKARNIPITLQQPYNYYMCSSASESLSVLQTMYWIRKSLIARPLFAMLPAETRTFDKRLGGLQVLELRITSRETIDSATVSDYLNTMRALLKDNGEPWFAEQMHESALFRAEEMLRIARQKSPMYELIIPSLVQLNSAVLNRFTLTEDPFTVAYLLYARSYLPIMLLTHNRSIVSQNIALIEKEYPTNEAFRLTSYVNSLSSQYSLDELKALIEQERNLF